MEEEQVLTKEQILDMLDAGQYKELKEETGKYVPRPILPRHWKILSRNRSLWCSVSWQKKRLLKHLLI